MTSRNVSLQERGDTASLEGGTEVVVLQSALDNAREELEEQRRLNQALIKRSVCVCVCVCVCVATC